MSSYGRRLLKELTIRYCDIGGSSGGVRDYIKWDLAAFQRHNAHCKVLTQVNRGRHPTVEAVFEHASPEKAERRHAHSVGLRNFDRAAVARELWWLAGSQGRPQHSRVPARHVVTRRPSIQGAWTVRTFGPAGAASAAAVASARAP